MNVTAEQIDSHETSRGMMSREDRVIAFNVSRRMGVGVFSYDARIKSSNRIDFKIFRGKVMRTKLVGSSDPLGTVLAYQN